MTTETENTKAHGTLRNGNEPNPKGTRANVEPSVEQAGVELSQKEDAFCLLKERFHAGCIEEKRRISEQLNQAAYEVGKAKARLNIAKILKECRQ